MGVETNPERGVMGHLLLEMQAARPFFYKLELHTENSGPQKPFVFMAGRIPHHGD